MMNLEIPSISATFLKAVNIASKSKKEIGALGEEVACEYLKRHGFRIVDRNVARKTGELDIVASEGETLHIVEVKSLVCPGFPSPITGDADAYDPSANLHEYKIRKVARTAEWYVANIDWEGEWQVDGCLVWLRERDGMARVRYLPQIL
ncbi:YraN family protein [Patescibacteria group bacterium]|nr:YraN family protein [Patescibacteria group bacterium]